ncbi:hypothetical protein [Edaphobacter modestus]|uniref:Uncharacterized protein n=1 Tax=Edaphobacter modestus TaxID=388466 RepID=A0A4Q7Z0W2_9BACT|nr:hypothetical protein [Edaphobacter modestus]RZU43119.1 hypothetical protein BDD14_4749 [Edaphobacter modestus]
MSWWDLWDKKSSDYIYAEIPGNKTRSGLDHTALVPKAGYVRIFLKTWRIDNIREGWSEFYGAVHGYISVPRFGGGSVDVSMFTSPNQLQNADPKHANRIISLNYPLFGPVPYMGGDLNVKIGLFSIKSADLSGPFLDMLSTVATAAGQGAYVAAVKPFIDTLKKGIEAVTDTDQDTRLEIGLVKTYDAPTTGYFVVIRADASTVDKSKFRVDNDDQLVDDSTGMPIRDYPYFVFTIEYNAEHQTWYEVADLQQAYSELSVTINDDNATASIIQSAYLRFRKKVKQSPDLIPDDTNRVLEEIRTKIADVTGVTVSYTLPASMAAVTKKSLTAPVRPASKKPLLRKRGKMPALKSLKIYSKVSKA